MNRKEKREKRAEWKRMIGDVTGRISFWKNLTTDQLHDFIKAGVNINAKDKEGFTPIHMVVAISENLKIIETLTQSGANINAKDKRALTPLHIAALLSKNLKVIRTLIQLGANINAKEMEGLTPLFIAVAENENVEIIKELIAVGANIKARKGNWFLRTLHRLILWYQFIKHPQFAKSGESVRFINEPTKKHTGQYDRNKFGLSILHFAALNENAEITKELIKAGADIHAETDGFTPLHAAAKKSKNIHIIEALIKEGAKIRARDNDGYTPYYYLLRGNDALKDDPKAIKLLRF